MASSQVFFTNLRTTPTSNLLDKMERLVRRAGIAGIDFENRFAAIKIHFGEPGNMAYLRPQYAARMAGLLRSLGAKPFLTDANTLYSGRRANAVDHLQSAMENGYNPISAQCQVIIADGLKGIDYREIEIDGEYCKAPKIGAAVADADIVISMTHFKGHEQTGFGGTLKNLGMGCASVGGKLELHCAAQPVVKTENCRGCNICVKHCAHDAIHLNPERKAEIDYSKCVGCGQCIALCQYDSASMGANDTSERLNYKIAEYTKAVLKDKPNFHVSFIMNVSRDRMLGITAYQSYRLFTGNQTTLGADYQRSGGRAWNRYPDRDEQLADKTLNDVAVYLNMQQTLARWMTLNAGVRMDYNPHFGAQWVPQFGISFPIAPETVLKAILSKGFRTPTIREMYMFPPQNPDLRPERLMNYEFSVTQSFWQRKLSLSANVYYLKGDNTIQAVFDGNRPINVNTGRIENYGVELTARYRAARSLAFSGNYSWLHMEYKILAAPQHKLYAGIDFIRPRWSVSTGVQYVRGLYTDLKAPGTEQFVLWNLRASWQASSVVELFARGENLLAQDYEINAGYPMPRATVFGGVNLRF